MKDITAGRVKLAVNLGFPSSSLLWVGLDENPDLPPMRIRQEDLLDLQYAVNRAVEVAEKTVGREALL